VFFVVHGPARAGRGGAHELERHLCIERDLAAPVAGGRQGRAKAAAAQVGGRAVLEQPPHHREMTRSRAPEHHSHAEISLLRVGVGAQLEKQVERRLAQVVAFRVLEH
jgi:hypothetical protein